MTPNVDTSGGPGDRPGDRPAERQAEARRNEARRVEGRASPSGDGSSNYENEILAAVQALRDELNNSQVSKVTIDSAIARCDAILTGRIRTDRLPYDPNNAQPNRDPHGPRPVRPTNP